MRKTTLWDEKRSQIRSVVTGYFGVDFLQKTRKREVCYPRQIYMYGLYIFTELGLKTIANDVGLEDHSTVISTVRKIRNLCQYDDKVRKEIIAIESLME